MSEGLYFIAVVPPANIQGQITDLKHLVKDRFGSGHALNAPPHITLHMPFKWKDKKVDHLLHFIQNINKQVEPFEVALKNFKFFEPRVVFIDVIENDALNSLQEKLVKMCRRDLKLDNGNYRDQPFHPHVTIAFRDLKKPQFYEARDFFKAQVANFEWTVENLELLKHDGMRWQIHK